MKSILFTGGCGFIGSHTNLLLLEMNYAIFILDPWINSRKSIDQIKLILEIKELIQKRRFIFLKRYKELSWYKKVFQKSFEIHKAIEAVIHFAGLKSLGESILETLNYWNNNVLGSKFTLRSDGRV